MKTVFPQKCLVCNGLLNIHSSLDLSLFYSCEHDCCKLPPYTRYYGSSRDNEIIMDHIIVTIDKVDYFLSYDKSSNISKLGKMRAFIEPIIKPQESLFVIDRICQLDYLMLWDDVESAKKVISRILNIKVFL